MKLKGTFSLFNRQNYSEDAWIRQPNMHYHYGWDLICATTRLRNKKKKSIEIRPLDNCFRKPIVKIAEIIPTSLKSR